jgi:hypothetical protein
MKSGGSALFLKWESAAVGRNRNQEVLLGLSFMELKEEEINAGI